MSQKDEESITKISRMLEIGGTMLAQHCPECGAPLFRYKGNIMCPVCDTGQSPSAQSQEKFMQKPVGHPLPTAASDEAKKQETSSVEMSQPATYSPAEAQRLSSMRSEVPVQKAISVVSLPDLEEILVKKTVMLAQSMQQEQDPRRIKEFLELIEKSLDIMERLKK